MDRSVAGSHKTQDLVSRWLQSGLPFTAINNVPPSASAINDQRLQRLDEDLANVGVSRTLASYFAEEVLYALYPPVHERFVPNFGSVTFNPYGTRADGVTWVQMRLPLGLPVSGLRPIGGMVDRGSARYLCDGYSTFLLADRDEVDNIVASSNPVTELGMVRLRSDGVSAVQRTGDGKVKLFLPEFLVLHDKNSWSVRPYSDAMADPIASAADLDAAVGERLLEIAVHVLSPANVGATLVWLLDDDAVSSPCFASDHSVEVAPFPMLSPTSFPAIRSLCSQVDRALVINVSGNLIRYGVDLRAPVNETIAVDGGTRHNSAANASVAEPRAVFYVISSDGPVSVFFQGHKIASFQYGQWAQLCWNCLGRGVERDGSCRSCDGTGRVWQQGPIVPERLRFRFDRLVQSRLRSRVRQSLLRAAKPDNVAEPLWQ